MAGGERESRAAQGTAGSAPYARPSKFSLQHPLLGVYQPPPRGAGRVHGYTMATPQAVISPETRLLMLQK